MRVRIHPSHPNGRVTLPPSKSAGHRAVLCAALAEGESRLENPGSSRDIEATLGAAEALGAQVLREGNVLRVTGVGGQLPERELSIDCGESGSTLRFLLPLLSLTQTPVTLTGRGRLLSRPLGVYEEIFAAQGIPFSRTEQGVCVGGKLRPAAFPVKGNVSSQFITGLLFALPLLDGDSAIRILPPFESRPYVDMTVEMLERFGVRADFTGGTVLRLPGRQRYRAASLAVEGDYSQMAFFAVLAAVRGEIACHGLSALTKQGDGVILDILRRCGAEPEALPDGWKIRESALTAHHIDIADCPDLGPILTVLAAFSKGETRLLHADRLRIKESDRAAVMEQELSRLGVRIECIGDTVSIIGGHPRFAPDTVVSCHNDHRIAMSLAVFAACAEAPVILEGAECVDKSYPAFFDDLRATGVGVDVLD